MASMIQKSLLLLTLIIALFHTRRIHCQQNIETFYPFYLPPPPVPTPSTVSSPPPFNFSQPPPPSLLLPAPLSPPSPDSNNSNKTLATAVAATAASTFVISGLVFFLVVRRRTMAQRRKTQVIGNGGSSPPPPPGVVSREDFSRFEGNVKGIIVDENGLDVLYWRKLNSGRSQKQRSSFRRETMKRSKEEEGLEERLVNRSRIQEVPLLRGESSTSEQKIHPEDAPSSGGPIPNPPSLQPPINHPPPPKPPEALTFAAVPDRKSGSPPPTPPPPPPVAKAPKLPLPPPPKTGTSGVSLKPPPAPGNVGASSSVDGSVKLKPLHWDKVNINSSEQSMVWNKIEGGSFKVDDDLMEALFGYVATNRKNSPQGKKSQLNVGNLSPGPSGQIFILETRKSQNIAIVLKSLALSRKEILDALTEGQGLTVDTLEKLNRISPTEEEESEILNFVGDPTKLADAESFLFHILRAVPSAFTRFNAMLFKLNYEAEILTLKGSIDTVDDGCKELRTRGLFTKLLEAVLKAGNRMNAGTSRGNAQAFNLNALKKLADVKSTDGKTTLLHFVLEEVVRSEGRKCVLNRSKSGTSQTRGNSVSSDNPEKEYIMLGLPIVGGLSQQFSNVRKAATIDYDSFSRNCSVLESRVSEIRELVSRSSDDGLGFALEMLGFLKKAEAEVSILRRQQNSVIELAKSTIEYYQGCSFKEKGSNPLQLFVIISDFLNMVDQVCVEIARNVQKKKIVVSEIGSSTRKTMRFPKLPPDFMSEKTTELDRGESGLS